MGNLKNIPKLRFPEFAIDGEWKEAKLGKILSIGSGKDYKHLKEGKIPVYGSGGYMLSVDEYLYDGESVCIGRKGTINNPMFLTGKFWTVDTLFYTHSFKDVSPFFVYLIFQNINWLNYNEAGGVPSLSKKIIEKIPILIPFGKEQQKIAACLSSLDDLITAHKEKLDILKEHKRGLLQNLFPQEGEKVPKYRFPEFENDGDWGFKEFSDLIKLYRGSSPRPIKKYLTQDKGGVNWIKIGDVESDATTIIKEVAEKITVEGAKKSREVFKGELILANSMSYGKVYELGISGCIYDGWFVLREYEQSFNKRFLFYLLNSNLVQQQYMRLAAGGIVKNISSKIVYQVSLPFTSTKEQQKIAETLSSLDSIIEQQQKKIEELEEHKKGLLQGLFPEMKN